jgi:hypothetical protein
MTLFTPSYKKPFSSFVKKQHKPFQAVIEDEVDVICKTPDIGEAKVGDLSGIYVHKFKHNSQEYLIAYHVPIKHDVPVAPSGSEDASESNSPVFLYIDFYKIGTHENFYADLKAYLKTTGWYK